MFHKIGAPKNFAKFTGKHLRWSLFFNKVEWSCSIEHLRFWLNWEFGQLTLNNRQTTFLLWPRYLDIAWRQQSRSKKKNIFTNMVKPYIIGKLVNILSNILQRTMPCKLTIRDLLLILSWIGCAESYTDNVNNSSIF